jgi:hypothetical protein
LSDTNPPEPSSIHLAARVSPAVVERLNSLAVALTAVSPLGDQVTRSAVLRRVIELGCDELERRIGKNNSAP